MAPKQGKKKKERTPAQKAKRKEKRKMKRAKAKAELAVHRLEAKGVGDYKLGYSTKRARAAALRGRGDYISDIVNTGRDLVGKGISGGVDWLAGKAKGFLSGLFGSGDYESSSAIPRSNSMWHTQAAPTVRATNGNPNIFVRCEMVTNIQSSVGFQTVAIPINPGLPQSFTWLSEIAPAYSQYRVHGMCVAYKSTCSAYGGADVNGSVLLSARYDVTQPAPTSLSQIENQEWTVPGRPVDNLLMAVECAPMLRPVNVLEIRTGELPDNVSQQLTDHCIVDVTNMGQADADVQIGTVYLCYEIELMNPVDEDGSAFASLSDHIYATGCTTAAPGGTAWAVANGSSIGGTLTGNGQYTFPSYITEGQFLLTYIGNAATSYAAAAQFTFFGCTDCKYAMNDTATLSSRAIADTKVSTSSVLVKINAPSASIQIDTGAITGAATLDVFVTAFNVSIVTVNRARIRWRKYYEKQAQHALEEHERIAKLVEREVTRRLTFAGLPPIDEVDEKGAEWLKSPIRGGDKLLPSQVFCGIRASKGEHGVTSVDYVNATNALMAVGRLLEKCRFCGMDPPDHYGIDCPNKPRLPPPPPGLIVTAVEPPECAPLRKSGDAQSDGSYEPL